MKNKELTDAQKKANQYLDELEHWGQRTMNYLIAYFTLDKRIKEGSYTIVRTFTNNATGEVYTNKKDLIKKIETQAEKAPNENKSIYKEVIQIIKEV